MKKFYELYNNSSIGAPVAHQLQNSENQPTEIAASAMAQLESSSIRGILTKISWVRHQLIMGASKAPEEREFYIRLAIQENYGKRELGLISQ